MISRRIFLFLGAALAAARATAQSPAPPIVFVHGHGDTAGIWQTTIWRFESNGWPRDRLFAIDMPLPLSRDDDEKAQAGRSSAAEHTAFLKSEVERILKATGSKQVVLVGNSRGCNTIRNYVYNAGGELFVSHAVLGGGQSHGIWAVHIDGLPDTSEYAGHGPYLTALNKPKNANGDEVAGPVKWMTIRSDKNDKYAQPDGLWVGKRGVDTGVTYAGPELKGATNVVIPGVDHRETSFSAAAFDAMYRFITGSAPARTDIVAEEKVILGGKISGAGTNIGLTGAQLRIFAIDPYTGERKGEAVYSKAIAGDGAWGPFSTTKDTRYEFEITAPGYATTHFYRSAFPRSSTVINMRPEQVPAADKFAPSLALMYRPRGYLDPVRDKMAFDGQSPPPGAVMGAGVATSRLKPDGLPRTIVAEFNGEKIVGRTWPLKDNHISVLELTS